MSAAAASAATMAAAETKASNPNVPTDSRIDVSVRVPGAGFPDAIAIGIVL